MFGEPFSEFPGRSGFARTLQAADEPYRRGTRAELRTCLPAQQIPQFVPDDFHYLLVRRKLQQHLGPKRLLTHMRDELVRHAQIHVGIEQRFANFGKRRVEVLFGELALSTKVLECALKLFCKCFKHGCPVQRGISISAQSSILGDVNGRVKQPPNLCHQK